ncbi:tumor necrosis factor alpha-induced protein 2 [Protopterus annectens]|uniref:tumor necrosis factor alpha-induced protein 2 n=1 Tax=Protopterus annectens TaxID=7888 RepID=UPI001CFB9D8C|nr:tumor necrosis factor alpha-induced protein 2 [Protopterus annectens]
MSHSTDDNVICTQQDENQHTSDESSSTEDIPSLTKALSDVKKKKKKIKKKIQKKLFQSHKNALPDDKLGNADSYQEENSNKSVAILLEETKDLISQQRFAEASRHLIDLEHKVYNNTEDEDRDADTLKKEQADVELTYEILYKEVITTLNDMLNIAQTNSSLLENAVNTIVQEEQEDENCAKDQEGHMSASPSRPRKWKEKFLTSLNRIVITRLSEDPCLISGNERLTSFAQHFNCVGRKVKQDLITVVTHVKKCFPQDYDICNVFARFLHDHFSSQMTNITDFILQKKDIHCILCWVLNIYPNDILNNPILVNDVHGNALGKLLPESKTQELEAEYVYEEMHDVIIWLQKSLSIEEDRWIKGNLPEQLDGCYHSELPIDVLQNFYGARDRAKEIKPKLEETMSQCLLAEFSQFLERYKKSLDEFKEKCSHQENYIPVIIANINNCFQFRKYLEQCSADSNMEDKRISLKILNNIEENGLKLLESLLSQKLKQHYKKLVKDKWLHGSESMDNILTSTDDYLLDIKGLKESYFQNLLRKIHLNIVVEYIHRLMKKKVSFKSPVQQQEMADEIMQHASEIKCLFEKYGSKETFLYEALLKLSEVIRLQDVSAIQIEVACLANVYRDIRKEHVTAILYIKANLSRSAEKSILKILNVSKEAVSSDTQELFSHIAVS